MEVFLEARYELSLKNQSIQVVNYTGHYTKYDI